MPYTIQIITASQTKLSGGALLAILADYWREDGNRVEIGPASSVTADIAIMHIDQTRVPHRWVPKNPGGRPLLNAAALDISKRRISANLVGRDSAWRGPVIVKTDLNHMGKPEVAARARWASDHRRLSRALRLIWPEPAPDSSAPYEIFASIEAVPAPVWKQRHLVVEKFRPEKHGGLFAVRSWIFFGDQGYVRMILGNEPFVRWKSKVEIRYPDEVPDALVSARRRLGFDFGKFDYVVVDGEVILFDANKTPYVPYVSERTRRQRLANGLYSFLQ